MPKSPEAKESLEPSKGLYARIFHAPKNKPSFNDVLTRKFILESTKISSSQTIHAAEYIQGFAQITAAKIQADAAKTAAKTSARIAFAGTLFLAAAAGISAYAAVRDKGRSVKVTTLKGKVDDLTEKVNEKESKISQLENENKEYQKIQDFQKKCSQNVFCDIMLKIVVGSLQKDTKAEEVKSPNP